MIHAVYAYQLSVLAAYFIFDASQLGAACLGLVMRAFVLVIVIVLEFVLRAFMLRSLIVLGFVLRALILRSFI